MAAFDVQRLISLGRVDAVALSPCGGWIAAAVARLDARGARYVRDLRRVPVDPAAGPPVRLTRGGGDDRAPCFRRDGSLGFLSDRNPREGEPEEGDADRSQVWLLPAGGGEPYPLTDEPLGVRAFRFAPAGDRLVVVAPVLPGVPHDEQRKTAAERKKHGPSALHYRRMPVRFWDHWLPEAAPHLIAYDEGGGGRRDLTPDADREHHEVQWDVSPDGARVAFTRARPAVDRVDERPLVVLDLATGAERVLGDVPRVDHERVRFSPDGGRIACSRHVRVDGALGRPRLYVYDLETGEGRDVAPDWDRFTHEIVWARAGDALLVTADDGGHVPLVRVDLATGEVVRVTAPEAGGSHGQIAAHPDGRRAVGVRHRLLHPPEPFAVDLAPGATPALLANLSGFDAAEGAAIADCSSFTVPGAGGDPVQSFLVRPAGAGDAPRPLLLWIHGGPIGMHADGWHWRWNPLVPVAAGYAVALPNPRGSTGFGQDFIEGIWNNAWGGACYEDLMAVTDALAARPDIDAGRMVAMGGSFGGYMTNWIGTQTDRFRCLVSHAGIYHLGAFHGVTDHPPWFALELGGPPHVDPEAFDRYSPHRFVTAWRSPTLIIHGERDYRVPIGEALALFEDLQARGVPSELLVFPDENHWILQPRNIAVWYRTFLDFVARHLEAGA